jgi:class 3 adenylate cyclase/tetratricopeptide (TPR) repeat protein
MLCPACQYDNVQQARFCQECGSPLPRSCTACGHELPPRARFCTECGTPVGNAAAPARVGAVQAAAAAIPDAVGPAERNADRRQAVVLFADISGYTAMCAQHDPEQVQQMLGSFFDGMDRVVEAHGGRVFDRAGDAVMAVFGAPHAHGNDAQRAVRAALAMQAAAALIPGCDGRPLRLHIGVASGEVVAAAISGGGKSKYSVTGGTVNLAARLDALAGPGDTLISDALHREVRGTVEAEAGGEHAVKGFAAPVTVWRVLGLSVPRGERLPFVGRQAEMRQLLGVLGTARETGSGTTLLVRGEAGIGKSRLLREFRQRAGAQGFDTPAGEVLDFGVGRGQGTIAMVLKSLLRIDPMADEPTRRAALQAAVGRSLVEGDEAIFVNEWLDLPQPPEFEAIHEAMDNATRLRRAGETLAAILRRAAALRPVLCIVEDIHWASPELLRQLAAVGRAVAQAPMILILSSRIDGDPIDKPWRASIGTSGFLTIDLAPLQPQEAQRLAGGLVEASSRFARLCIERAEGNPLFLEQLLRTARADEAVELPPVVPPTIQSLVLERMDRLAVNDREALQAAAVIGKRFSLGALRGVAGDPGLHCQALVAADLVRADGPDFLFSHALIQEAVYASTLKSRRRELHRAAAQWFGAGEAVLQAEHLDRAEDKGAAAACLRAAAEEAARQRFESALRLAERGGVLASSGGPTGGAVGCDLALLRGEVLREIGRSTDSIAAFREALAIAGGEPKRCCHAWMGIAGGHRVTGEFDAAMDALAHAGPIAEQLALDVERSQIHHTRGNLFFAQGRIEECDAQHALALQFAERSGSAESQARAQSGLGDARYAQGRMRSALAHFQRCVALSGGQIRIAAPARCMIGHCFWYLNALDAGIDEARSARDDAQRSGVVSVLVFAQATVTQLLTEAGRFEEASEACARALELARLAGSRRYEATMLMFSADCKLRSGQRAAAFEDQQQALALSRQTGLGFIGAALMGRLARTSDNAADRARCLAEGVALLQQTGISHNRLWFYREAIESSLEVGEADEALAFARALEEAFLDEPLPWVALVVERARALVDAQRGAANDEILARLRRVREAIAAAGAGWAAARVDAALARSRVAASGSAS